MSATDELRRLLDERGVAWTKPKSATEFIQTTFLRNGWGIEVLERNIGLCVTATNVFDTPEQAIAATLGSMSTSVDDVLSLLDEMNERDRIEYADYSQLHDAIAATLGEDEKLLDLAHHAWSIAVCAMHGMPIPASWGNAVEKGLRERGIDVDKLPYVVPDAALGDADKSRWFELFGTPERAARTLARMCFMSDGSCAGCPMFRYDIAHCKSDYSNLGSIVEWLESEVRDD